MSRGASRLCAAWLALAAGCAPAAPADDVGAIAGGAAPPAASIPPEMAAGSGAAGLGAAPTLAGTGGAAGVAGAMTAAMTAGAGGSAAPMPQDASVPEPAADGSPAPAPTFRVFLLIGQSNMSGGAMTNEGDLVEDDRIEVLGFDDCPATGRKYNEWDTASPPLHACWTNGIGPGDHFAKTLIASLPAGDRIGLIPSAFPGAGIDMFRKGVVSAQRGDFFIPPDDHWQGAYDWMIERARLAQRDGGVIEGIVFHQGETDNGQDVWVDKVIEMVEDLRADLGLGPLPFVAGELLYGGCCERHNEEVHRLATTLENATYVSTADLVGIDAFHFDAEGVRILGRRYGEAMAEALGLSP